MAEALVSHALVTRGEDGTTATVTHRLTRPANFVTDTIATRAPRQRPINSEFASVLREPGYIVVIGDVDSNTAATLDRQIAVESRSGIAPLTIDLSGVTHLGSAGVAALAAAVFGVLAARRLAARRGLGWDIDSIYSRPRGSVFPPGSFGHTGYTGTCLWIDPFSKTFFIFLSNRNHPDGKGNVLPLYSTLGTLAAKAVKDFDFNSVPGALPVREPDVRAGMNPINGK